MLTRLLIAEVLAIAVLAVVVHFGLHLPAPFSMPVHRLLHIAGVIVFVGNVVVGALLVALADMDGTPPVQRFVSRTIQLADGLFTGPGILVLLYNGAVLAEPFGGLSTLRWLWWGWMLFLGAGVLWAVVLIPLQHRMVVLADAADREAWVKNARLYSIPGAVSLLILGAVLALMVLKPL